ncbi:ABC-type glycerol-3-phosphate transport system substrate-binding protein [Phyllobacterium trifolii]|uniref:ABC-type glycerol-3-phosphate transport system substrate-binding protein n=1 Tax=Phyllobacterium trifolii TaxID=300193 RepID=A0A839UI79_9HYPH|nr:hypothetical protein [Phyllobacterium trifolii]MBB3148482.1 ABC-type glycerol-3-phosphate transport system substrate-binding protein [Phyllobacterium trifolii]
MRTVFETSQGLRLTRRRLLAMLTSASIAIAMPMASANETITVYTALEKEQLAPYAAAFQKAHPDVTIAWLRDSPGVILARLLAEKDNPRADVVWGVPRFWTYKNCSS